MYLNKTQIIGNLVRDPELKALPNGNKVASFSVATNRTWKDNNGTKQEETEYHNIVAFGKQAEVLTQYCKKGDSLYVEGRLQTRSWESDGKKQYKTEIIVENFQFGTKSKDPVKEPISPAKNDTLPSVDFGYIDNFISFVDDNSNNLSSNICFGIDQSSNICSITSSDLKSICIIVLDSQNITRTSGAQSSINLKPFFHEVGTYYKFSDCANGTTTDSWKNRIFSSLGTIATGCTVFFVNPISFKTFITANADFVHILNNSAIMNKLQAFNYPVDTTLSPERINATSGVKLTAKDAVDVEYPEKVINLDDIPF